MSRICWICMALGSIGLLIGMIGVGPRDMAWGHQGATLIGASLIGLCILERKM